MFSKFNMLVCFTLQPFCSLHLQLQMSENPYLSGSISTKSSAPGIIVATGMIYTLMTTFGPTTPPGYVPYSFSGVHAQMDLLLLCLCVCVCVVLCDNLLLNHGTTEMKIIST